MPTASQCIIRGVGNYVIRISAAEAASDFPALLDHVRASDEVVIERDPGPAAVVGPVASALIRRQRQTM